ncbi:MAG: branched-chain amino acid ABC transporter permease [Candidatus Bathyarchaeia archaeon]
MFIKLRNPYRGNHKGRGALIAPGTLAQAIISGILLGGIYALMSIGLNLIFGVVKVVNFAHGEFLMIGMYIAYWAFALYGLDPYVSLPLVALSILALGALTQGLIINPLLKTKDINQVLATIGLMIFLENLALFLWKSDFRSVLTAYSAASISMGEIRLSLSRIFAFAVAMSTAIVLYFLLTKTDVGRRIRAVAQDAEAAELMGIDHRRIYIATFGLGGALVGVAAAAMSPIYYAFPTVGALFGPTAFIVVVLGGLGSFIGAMIGGLIIGIVESIAGVLTNAELAKAFAFAIFLLVLFRKPTGLFGERARV